jgi:aspartyl-tRNA synthetase
VHRRRDHGGLIFIDLRDRFGLTQIVFDPKDSPNCFEKAKDLRSEWVIEVQGAVRLRGEGLTNPKMKTGEIEVLAAELTILSKAITPPFSIADENIDVHEEKRLRYRYLDIRRGEVMKNLLLRDKLNRLIRSFMADNDFVEVATPLLGRSTPEGSRDYLVPSRIHPGQFYALPQSPQIYKQLLMVAGLDRYYQIATCLRDEDLRSDRQPEFTQLDMELSFSNPQVLMELIEKLFHNLFKELVNYEAPTPFQRLSFHEALNKYGTDRPDLRFKMELVDATDIAAKSEFSVFNEEIKGGGIVKGLKVVGGQSLSRKDIDNYTAFVGQLGIKGLAWMKYKEGELSSSIVKFFSNELQKELIERFELESGDLIFMISGDEKRTHIGLDHLRRKLAEDLSLIPKNSYAFAWITDFPMFEYSEEQQKIVALHHPFTMPHQDDLSLMESDPLKVRSIAYDLVLNGYELGGGSQRIHDQSTQSAVFKVLELSKEEAQKQFGFFLEALSYGTPPHLGIAFGLDRIAMLLAGTANIRDVIAFPKTQRATDLMSSAPSEVDPQQLRDLKIELESPPDKTPELG